MQRVLADERCLTRVSKESCCSEKREGGERGSDQGVSEGCAGILHQENRTKFRRSGLLYWGIYGSRWNVRCDVAQRNGKKC